MATKKSLPNLGDKVIFMRINPAQITPPPDPKHQPAEIIRGKGVVVGLIVGISRRVQVMVKDSETSQNKAWTLEPFCINPTADDEAEYLEHHNKLQGVVDEFNKKSADAIKEGNDAV